MRYITRSKKIGEIIMNKKIILALLFSLMLMPCIKIEARPPLMVDDGTTNGEDFFSFEALMKATDLPVSAPSTEKQSDIKLLCQYVGLMIFMKVIDLKNWCQRSCKMLLEKITCLNLLRHES